jgi:hypothetical protein
MKTITYDLTTVPAFEFDSLDKTLINKISFKIKSTVDGVDSYSTQTMLPDADGRFHMSEVMQQVMLRP